MDKLTVAQYWKLSTEQRAKFDAWMEAVFGKKPSELLLDHVQVIGHSVQGFQKGKLTHTGSAMEHPWPL